MTISHPNGRRTHGAGHKRLFARWCSTILTRTENDLSASPRLGSAQVALPDGKPWPTPRHTDSNQGRKAAWLCITSLSTIAGTQAAAETLHGKGTPERSCPHNERVHQGALSPQLPTLCHPPILFCHSTRPQRSSHLRTDAHPSRRLPSAGAGARACHLARPPGHRPITSTTLP